MHIASNIYRSYIRVQGAVVTREIIVYELYSGRATSRRGGAGR